MIHSVILYFKSFKRLLLSKIDSCSDLLPRPAIPPTNLIQTGNIIPYSLNTHEEYHHNAQRFPLGHAVFHVVQRYVVMSWLRSLEHLLMRDPVSGPCWLFKLAGWHGKLLRIVPLLPFWVSGQAQQGWCTAFMPHCPSNTLFTFPLFPQPELQLMLRLRVL